MNINMNINIMKNYIDLEMSKKKVKYVVITWKKNIKIELKCKLNSYDNRKMLPHF